MKQTSIEWLANQILDNWNDITAGARNVDEFIQQAKQMHKEEIVGAINDSWNMAKNSNFYNAQAEQYYNETFKQDKQ